MQQVHFITCKKIIACLVKQRRVGLVCSRPQLLKCHLKQRQYRDCLSSLRWFFQRMLLRRGGLGDVEDECL